MHRVNAHRIHVHHIHADHIQKDFSITYRRASRHTYQMHAVNADHIHRMVSILMKIQHVVGVKTYEILYMPSSAVRSHDLPCLPLAVNPKPSALNPKPIDLPRLRCNGYNGP